MQSMKYQPSESSNQAGARPRKVAYSQVSLPSELPAEFAAADPDTPGGSGIDSNIVIVS